MCVLSEIRAAIATRYYVEIVAEDSKFAEPGSDSIVQWVTIFVVVTAGLYDANRLNQLMEGLSPSSWSRMTPFVRGHNAYMGFGHLELKEVIGQDMTTGVQRIAIRDTDVELPREYDEGVREIEVRKTRDLHRHITVRLYPDPNYAAEALRGQDVHSTNNLVVPA